MTQTNKELVDDRKRVHQERSQIYAQNRLRVSLNKRMKTIMIGAVAAFEDSFGQLWGIDKNDSELTEEEKMFKGLWEQTRTTVLNKGNNQARLASEELGEYTTQWNRHYTEIILRR
jgi:hypothetical protein